SNDIETPGRRRASVLVGQLVLGMPAWHSALAGAGVTVEQNWAAIADRRETGSGPKRLVGACEPAHGEFDLAARQFAPAFDGAHIGRLGVAIEELARPISRLFARQRKSLAPKAVLEARFGRSA